MIWNAGDGAVRVAAAAAGPRARGTLEQALPGEWAALVLTLVAIALVGAAILVAACLGHERVVARRRARRSARGGAARGGSTRMVA
jgi:hypothetical protein